MPSQRLQPWLRLRPLALALALTPLVPTAPSLQAAEGTHASLQSVTEAGLSAWSGEHPVTLRGVLLTDPTEMLDATPAFQPWDDGANQFRMGGEWQIVFQATEPGDRGGTTCWMGQNYGNQPWLHSSDLSYPNPDWVREILRLNHDPETGRPFRRGDLIEVTAQRSLFYGGKRNLNEAHDIAHEADFTLRLLAPEVGLPEPERVTLAQLVRPDDGDPGTSEALFDPTREAGGEHYQGMRVRLDGLRLLSAEGWDPKAPWANRRCQVTDDEQRFFTLRHPRFSLGPAPTGRFDAIGVLSQESGSGTQGTNGYELFVQQVLPEVPPSLAIENVVRISWPDHGGAYTLEHAADAANAPWIAVTHQVREVEGTAEVLLPPSAPRQFYRLQPAE